MNFLSPANRYSAFGTLGLGGYQRGNVTPVELSPSYLTPKIYTNNVPSTSAFTPTNSVGTTPIGTGGQAPQTPSMRSFGNMSINPNDYLVNNSGGLFNTSQYNGDLMLKAALDNPEYNAWFQSQPVAQQNLIRNYANRGIIIGMNQNEQMANLQLNSMQNTGIQRAWTPQEKLGAFQAGVGALTSLFGMYQGLQQLKFAKEDFRERQALQRANYKVQARQLNANYRDQLSGRGTAVMSRASKAKLGQTYNNRKVDETYV